GSLESVSRDGRLMVYSIRRSGKDESELRVRDVATGADAADVMPEGLYRGASLDGDAHGFYYALQDRATGSRIRYHALGTPASADREVFGSGYGPSQWVNAFVSENGRHLVFTVAHGWQRNEIWVHDPPAQGPAAAGREGPRPPLRRWLPRRPPDRPDRLAGAARSHRRDRPRRARARALARDRAAARRRHRCLRRRRRQAAGAHA